MAAILVLKHPTNQVVILVYHNVTSNTEHTLKFPIRKIGMTL